MLNFIYVDSKFLSIGTFSDSRFLKLGRQNQQQWHQQKSNYDLVKVEYH